MTVAPEVSGSIEHLVVPIDDSSVSWRGFDFAAALAVRCHADIRLLAVVFDPQDIHRSRERLDAELVRRRPPTEINISIEVVLSTGSVASEIERVTEHLSGAVVVMSPRGRGRSAALLGSVALDLLDRMDQPIMLVGAEAVFGDFSGRSWPPSMVPTHRRQRSRSRRSGPARCVGNSGSSTSSIRRPTRLVTCWRAVIRRASPTNCNEHPPDWRWSSTCCTTAIRAMRSSMSRSTVEHR